ncbi:MAG TPA: squalene--hopene cyclase [Planctomycetota bacterium]|nr:squalene--hopene cyclase [Planctomycetota bacterium]
MSEALLRESYGQGPTLPGGPQLHSAIETAQRYLLSRQSEGGFWQSELNGDATLESDAVMLMHFLGDVDKDRQRRLLNYVFTQQNADGGWSIFKGGPSDINATVKAYFALRLAGFTDDDPQVRKARHRVIDLGGLEVCNSYTKFYLAIFGQYNWSRLPCMIPEIMMLPQSQRFLNIYRVSSWTRTIIVPMLIIYACRPSVKIPFSIRDLNLPYDAPGAKSLKNAFWRGIFKFLDRGMAVYNRLGVRWVRRIALRKAEDWMLERNKPAGGLGAIYPPMLNTIMALRCLGYAKDSPEFAKALAEFRALEVQDGPLTRVQPCFSAIWDTSWALHALARGNAADTAAVQKAADWLLSKEVFTGGDWQVNNPAGKPGAWAFEFDNPVYPDTDDTSSVLMGLYFAGRRDDPGFSAAVQWLHSMQNTDGGWGAFDRNIDLEILEHLPWADHNALLDPSTADLTGRIIEMFGYIGSHKNERFMTRAIQFLRKSQEADGSWFGRWGVNYIYGTWQVLVGLRSAGVDMREGWVQKAASWFRGVQNADGGWGESCRSYNDPRVKGRGVSTPSQTAWAVLGLLATDAPLSDPSLRRGIEWLLKSQRTDGGWDETEHTGTGFPGVFYLVYTMYRHYFPLLALQAVRDGMDPRARRPATDRFELAGEASERMSIE